MTTVTFPSIQVNFVDENKKISRVWYQALVNFQSNLNGFLIDSNNLSDVISTSTALTNLGGSPLAGSTSLTTLGTISTGTWNGNILVGTYGGTGVNNDSKTITLGGNIVTANSFTTVGNFTVTQTYTSNTSVTFPVSGTLATTSQLLPTYTNVTGTSGSLIVNQTFGANNAGLCTLTLPITAATGSVIKVHAVGAGGFRIAQNAGQTIHNAASASTAGVGGHIDSSAQWDSVTIECVTADTTWIVSASKGTINVT